MAAAPALTEPVQAEYLSYWVKSSGGVKYSTASGEIECDVAVVGGGIVGVTTALTLQRAGARVALIEARHIGAGATGYTTAKVTSLHGTIYQQLTGKYGDELARGYGEMNQGGLEAVAGHVDSLGIDCDFRRKAHLTIALDDSDRTRVEEEARTAKDLGLPASFVEEVGELPLDVAGAVQFSDQAEFHPLKYLTALTAAAANEGCQVYEGSRVMSVDEGDPCKLETDDGATVTAGCVVLATHLPIGDHGFFSVRNHPERSYALLVRLAGEVPQGMYLSTESPAHTMRPVRTEEGERFLIGGEAHRPGEGGDAERFARLEDWAREKFDVASVDHRWATHDHLPNDLLPFIGRAGPFSDRVLAVTGLRKWGLAMGTAAAQVISDQILDRDNPWSDTFDPIRLHPIAGGPSFLKHAAASARHLALDRVVKRGSAEDLAPGEGAIVGSGFGQRAAYRDESGRLHSLSARCTHMGCIVNFNDAERTWDCPCHGSRFNTSGEVIEGPAVKYLEKSD
jgi:glycine/D-amino acid oxidase-like deaminating enzyme/nitrite reductase/ring-hydroxylating ferredoxin subunit